MTDLDIKEFLLIIFKLINLLYVLPLWFSHFELDPAEIS